MDTFFASKEFSQFLFMYSMYFFLTLCNLGAAPTTPLNRLRSDTKMRINLDKIRHFFYTGLSIKSPARRSLMMLLNPLFLVKKLQVNPNSYHQDHILGLLRKNEVLNPTYIPVSHVCKYPGSTT